MKSEIESIKAELKTLIDRLQELEEANPMPNQNDKHYVIHTDKGVYADYEVFREKYLSAYEAIYKVVDYRLVLIWEKK